MKRCSLLFLFFLSYTFIQSQQLSPVVLNSGGSVNNGGEYYLSLTLGEVAINTHTKNEATLIQGFQQAVYYFPVPVVAPPEELKIRIYPNPTIGKINVELKGSNKSFTAEVFDLFGRCVLRQVFVPPSTVIHLDNLKGSTYLVRISDFENRISGLWRIQVFH